MPASVNAFISACEIYLENLIKSMNPASWGVLEWLLCFVTIGVVIKIIVSSTKAIIKAAILIALILFLGYYFGCLKV